MLSSLVSLRLIDQTNQFLNIQLESRAFEDHHRVEPNSDLADEVDVNLFKRGKPTCNVPEMNYGGMANDRRKHDKGLGNLILDREARAEIWMKLQNLSPFIRPFVGSEEFLNGTERWCLWLADASPSLIRKSELVQNRIEAVRQARLNSGGRNAPPAN